MAQRVSPERVKEIRALAKRTSELGISQMLIDLLADLEEAQRGEESQTSFTRAWEARARKAEADLEEAREQRRGLREALKRLEWGPVVYVGGWPNPYCPSCQRMRDSGHSKDCSLAKLLAATEDGNG